MRGIGDEIFSHGPSPTMLEMSFGAPVKEADLPEDFEQG